MKYKITQEKGTAKISFSATPDEWEQALDNAYKAEAHKYSMQGFRKGKVPRRMIEKVYGESVFFDEAFNDLIYRHYSTVLDEHPELYPVERPSIAIDGFGKDGIKFTATVTLKPEVELGQYKGLTIEIAKVEVKDEAVDAEIERARERRAKDVEISDRPAALGDTVTIDYSGSVDGVVFDGGTAQNQNLVLGSASFIPGFEDQIVGLEIGGERDITVKFPDDYHAEELKGKEAVFAIKLHAIKVNALPELDDDFAKEVSHFDTLAEYKADTKRILIERAERHIRSENEHRVLDAVVGQSKVDIPGCMVEYQIDQEVEEFAHRLSHQGMDFETFLQYTGSTMEDYRKKIAPDAEKTVRTRLVAEAIVAAEQIQVSEEDVEQKLASMGEIYKKTADEVREQLGDAVDHLENQILTEKLLKLLFDSNTLTTEPVAKPEAEAQPAKKPATKKAAAKPAGEGEPAKKPATKKAAAKPAGEGEPAKKPATRKKPATKAEESK